MIPPKRPPTAVYKQRILDALRSSSLPLAVENVRITAGLHNWESTKALLLELMVERRIKGLRTAKGWIFWHQDQFNHNDEIPVQQLQP